MEDVKSSIKITDPFDPNESHGPRVGLKLNQEQASFILRRHNLGKQCQKLSWVNRGFNNKTYFITSNSKNNDGIDEYVVRLSGIAWTRMKTENEVASILYLREKCQDVPVPKIFGFCSDKTKSLIGCEYIIMEKLEGTPLDTFFSELSFDERKQVVQDVVRCFGKLQTISFDKIGSLQFSKEIGDTLGLDLNLDEIVPRVDIHVGPGLEANGGPFMTYLDFLRATLTTELKLLHQCIFLIEGEGLQLAHRIKSFINKITDPEMSPLSEDILAVPFAFTHGDFETRNLLVDRNTLKVTGVLDFEFSGSFPLDENWFAGFQDFGADTAEWIAFGDIQQPDEEDMLLATTEERDKVKTYFLQQCQIAGVKIPSEIPGHFERALLYHFKSNICPWWMREPISGDDPVPEKWLQERHAARQRVKVVLEKYGF